MQGLQYIFDHKNDPHFFSQSVHQLANQFLSIIIFLNSFAGRCGAWELISREDMIGQLSNPNTENILTFHRQKTALVYGPLRKWAPRVVPQALRLYNDLPLRESEFFFTPHTDVPQVICAHLVQCASVTLGHRGAVPNTNFIRKLFATLIASGEGVFGDEWNRAIDDLARIDAHSAEMARSVHYNVSDKIKRRWIRAFFAIMKALPLEWPDELLSDEDFAHLVQNMGKRGAKRRAP